MIFVSASISLDDSEFQERFIRSPGPGGQNANKVATAVQLRFDVARSPSLPIQVKRWLIQLAGRRLSNDGVLTIEAHRFRARVRNREDALVRLVELVRKAAHQPKLCKKTKLTRASQERRLVCKRQRSKTKRLPG